MKFESLEKAIKAGCYTGPVSSLKITEIAKDYFMSPREVIQSLLSFNIWPERFTRQKDILSSEQMRELLKSNIFIAGCGGLGGYVANILARIGVGGFILCDPDNFEETNLNRQLYCTEKTLGLPKAEVLKERLLEIASYLEIRCFPVACTKSNLPDLLKGADIVIDCLDSVSGKNMLEKAAKYCNLPYLHGAVLQSEGIIYYDNPGCERLDTLYGDPDLKEATPQVLCTNVCATASLMCSILLNALFFSKKDSTPIYHLDCSIPELEQFL